MAIKHMTLGERVRYYREGVGWTLDQLSERTLMPDGSFVDRGTISALENRKSQRSKFTRAIAYAFGLTQDQLMSDKDYLPDLLSGKIHAHYQNVPDDPESSEFEKAINTLRDVWLSGSHELRTNILMGIPILIGIANKANESLYRSEGGTAKLLPQKPNSQ